MPASRNGRKGGTLVNVLVFVSAATVVGFVSWLLLLHLFPRTPRNYESEKLPLKEVVVEEQVTKQAPPELTAEQKLKIQKELDRRKAEKERKLIEKAEKDKEERISKNVKAVEQALAARQWKVAENKIGLLLDDEYALTEVARFNDLIVKGKAKEREDILEVEKLLTAAKQLDDGKYSAEAVALLDRALLIYPMHAPSVELRKKINAYPYSLRVPEDVATLSDAVDRLRAGDTAILGAGVHKFPTLLNKGVNIKGQGEKLTSIECDTTTNSAFTLTGADEFYTISDLTVTGSNYEDDRVERFPLIALNANLTMRNVTVEKGSGHGVAVISGKLIMEKCHVSKNAWDGVSVMGVKSVAEIKDSDISGNFDHGVDFWNGASGKLTNVTADENAGTGVLIMGLGAKVDLVQVKTQNNSQCGIVINSQAEAKMERVFSSGNLLSGLVLQGKGTKLTCGIIVSNKNGEAGYFIDPASTVENFISATAEGNRAGNVIREAMVLPKIPKVPEPPVAVPVPEDVKKTI